MRVLLTGATGFIGSHLLRLLTRQGHEVIAGVRRAHQVVPGCQTLVWDFSESRLPRPHLVEIDAVVHAAQSRNYRAFPADGPEMFRVNVAGTWSLLDYAAACGVRHFCLLSSGSVYEPYGDGELREETVLAPPGLLGATKLAAEILTRPYEALFSVSVLRLFFPFGPGQENRIVPDIIERVRTGKPVELSSDGEGLQISPTYVDDIVDVVLSAMTKGWAGTMNVASPKIVSLRELAEAVGQIVGRSPTFVVTNRPPVRIVPSLDRLGAHFELARFTPLGHALRMMMSK